MKDLTKGEVIGLIVAIAKKVSEQQATGIQSISWDGQTNSLIFTMSDGSTISTEISLDATDVPYSNTTSGLTATNIQAAIDELNLIKGVGQTYPNSTHGEIFNSYANNVASGDYSHTEGNGNITTAICGHNEGENNTCSGEKAHSEGYSTKSTGYGAHSQNIATTASGRGTHAGGYHTIAGYDYQTAIGTYNNNKSTNLFEIGNGTSTARSNAFEVSNAGIAYASGIQLATLNDLPQMIDLTGGTA